MQYTINQLYDLLCQRVSDIYDTFKDYFGEDYVDLQSQTNADVFKKDIAETLDNLGIKGEETVPDIKYEISDSMLGTLSEKYSEVRFYIYVWWPSVRVTNENGRSITIKDLYAKVGITLEGRIPYENRGFLLNRATYTLKQFNADYMHSHISSIPKYNFTEFQSPCLGRGPIRNTISSLKNEYDSTTWMLFCKELSMYVTVESLSGGPYHRMESIGGDSVLSTYPGYRFFNLHAGNLDTVIRYEDIKNFVKYYLRYGHLSLSFKHGKFVCGMPYHEYIIDLSNAFIDFYNANIATTQKELKKLYDNGVLCKAIFKDGGFYLSISSNTHDLSSVERYQNKLVLNFKGKEIYTSIVDDNVKETETFQVNILSHYTAMGILKKILRTINFRFKNEQNNREGGKQETSSTSQRIIYL